MDHESIGARTLLTPVKDVDVFPVYGIILFLMTTVPALG